MLPPMLPVRLPRHPINNFMHITVSDEEDITSDIAIKFQHPSSMLPQWPIMQSTTPVRLTTTTVEVLMYCYAPCETILSPSCPSCWQKDSWNYVSSIIVQVSLRFTTTILISQPPSSTPPLWLTMLSITLVWTKSQIETPDLSYKRIHEIYVSSIKFC